MLKSFDFNGKIKDFAHKFEGVSNLYKHHCNEV